MDKEIIIFRDTEIEKYKFHHHKNAILIDDVNIDKILITSKVINTLLAIKMMKKLSRFDETK